VAGGVDDVEAVLGVGQVHALPEAGHCSGRDGDAALLLLLHPVGGGSAVVHLAQLVGHARVEQDALGGGGLAGVDVGRDTNIAVALNGGLASHGFLSLTAQSPPARNDGSGFQPSEYGDET